jgi:hypothetical protein
LSKDTLPAGEWGKGNVRRLLGTGAGLIFKGSGFYITDYRSDSYKEGAKKRIAFPRGKKQQRKRGRQSGREARARNGARETAGN